MRHLYLRSAVWDSLLVLAASCALAYTLLAGFYVSPDLQYGPVPAIVCAVVLVGLFAAGSSRRAAAIGGPVVGVALIVFWVVAASMTPDGAFLEDTESNYFIFAMCTSLCAVGCFLLSRRRLGAALLFIVGAFLVAFIQFFYGQSLLLWAFVFVASSLALLIFKNYQESLRASTSVKKVAFAPGFAVALVACGLAVGIGAGVWYGIIAPMSPGAVEVKLITEYRALETVQVKGIADIFQIPNLEMTSDQTNDGERTTDDDSKESENGRAVEVFYTGDEQNEVEDSSNSSGTSFMGLNLDNPDDVFDLLNYLQEHLLEIVIALALVVAAIVAAFIVRRVHRSRRLQRIAQLSPSGQVAALYPFFVQKFERLGIAKADGQTLPEYALANAGAVEIFDKTAGATFADLTADYAAVTYGGVELGQESAARLEAYYKAFWKAARRKLGAFKYFFKSFRLG